MIQSQILYLLSTTKAASEHGKKAMTITKDGQYCVHETALSVGGCGALSSHITAPPGPDPALPIGGCGALIRVSPRQ